MHAAFSNKAQQARIQALEEEVQALQTELGQGVDAEAIVKTHIKLLHRYNEAKDACQLLIGKLAQMKQTTLAQLHADLELPLGD
ncbi:hypothetical protein CYLTODRAFT_457507 [Cylindrobasidium torrendii FP15055 ss-10]|uniref:Swi5-domain-containing protein n=1 Tax=Cylindrobasidium torrendii FP15055 ss-10 TaxID=1314674 RepID=A0A0D7B3K3_9AGAR|nr:hypothetical protein CYLTODRAFT_457507 [Cylindrobasidium torrendii FP15055 ss-10]